MLLYLYNFCCVNVQNYDVDRIEQKMMFLWLHDLALID